MSDAGPIVGPYVVVALLLISGGLWMYALLVARDRRRRERWAALGFVGPALFLIYAFLVGAWA